MQQPNEPIPFDQKELIEKVVKGIELTLCSSITYWPDLISTECNKILHRLVFSPNMCSAEQKSGWGITPIYHSMGYLK